MRFKWWYMPILTIFAQQGSKCPKMWFFCKNKAKKWVFWSQKRSKNGLLCIFVSIGSCDYDAFRALGVIFVSQGSKIENLVDRSNGLILSIFTLGKSFQAKFMQMKSIECNFVFLHIICIVTRTKYDWFPGESQKSF